MQRVFTLMQRVQLHMQKDSHTCKRFFLSCRRIKTKATGHSSHSEGSETTAGGSYSHAEGKHTIALGEAAHAEGTATIANGFSSHAEGNHTSTAHFAGSHIMGRFGTADESYSGLLQTAQMKPIIISVQSGLLIMEKCILRALLTMQAELILHKCLKQ